MANTFIKIQTVTVGAGGASNMEFTSIPQTYTDLKIVLSTRSNNAGASDAIKLTFNNSTSGYSYRYVYGTGSAGASGNALSQSEGIVVTGNGATSTANIFGNIEVYIPNYTSANYKSYSNDGVYEDNTTLAYQYLLANIWANTAAITSIKLVPNSGTLFNQYTTATLYGIKSS
jgi:hypothetical protein